MKGGTRQTPATSGKGKPVATPPPPPPAATGMARPKPLDFSPEAVSRAVLQQTLQRPHVLYPAAIGVLGGLAALLLGPSLVFVVPAVLGLGAGVGGWALDYTLGKQKHSAEVLNALRERLSGQRSASMARLQANLDALDFAVGTAQLEQLQRKFEAFGALLGRKLDPQELTYGRYLAMTEQVFLAGIDNLNRVVDTLQALSTIDVAKLQARIHQLETDEVESRGQDLEIKTLRERLVFQDGQRAKIDQWLADNEAAMSQMDQVMAAIADMETSSGQASMPMEAAMQELKALADRASLYSVSR
jgi:hypothetical protein